MATMSIETAEKRLRAAEAACVRFCVSALHDAADFDNSDVESVLCALLDHGERLVAARRVYAKAKREAKKLKTERDVERVSKTPKGRKVKRARKA